MGRHLVVGFPQVLARQTANRSLFRAIGEFEDVGIVLREWLECLDDLIEVSTRNGERCRIWFEGEWR